MQAKEVQEIKKPIIEEEPKTWSEKNWAEKLFYLYDKPLDLLRKGTIPAANDS
jgi:hypothetical protein